MFLVYVYFFGTIIFDVSVHHGSLENQSEKPNLELTGCLNKSDPQTFTMVMDKVLPN